MLTELDLDPMQIKSIAERVRAVEHYAERFVEEVCQHETLNDYAAQCAADWKQPTMAREIKMAVRALWRKQRQR